VQEVPGVVEDEAVDRRDRQRPPGPLRLEHDVRNLAKEVRRRESREASAEMTIIGT
jgi:hypothetical protein